MVSNLYIRCDRCDTNYRLRWQVEDYKAAILIRCPKCNSKIKGYLKASDNVPEKVIRNATEVPSGSEEYVQEISSMFITHKLTPADQFNDVITPFVRSDIYSYSKLVRYLQFIEAKSNETENIHDLLVANSTSYLKKKLRDDNNVYIAACKSAIKKYRLNSQVDLLMASHQYIMSMLLGSGIDKSVCYLMKDITELTKNKPNEIKEFAKLVDNGGYYKSLNAKFPELVNLYEENYLSFIPVRTAADMKSVDFDDYGLSSVDYEDLLELYRKCYEFIGEFIINVVGLNNIEHRGGCCEFTKGYADIEQKVNQEDKYNRIQSFVKVEEKFSKGFADTLNKIIRNAEAHFDVQYDIFSQKIKFINKGKRNTDIEEMYLLQFALETIRIFDLAVSLWEIAYQLQKNRMVCDLRMDWEYGKP